MQTFDEQASSGSSRLVPYICIVRYPSRMAIKPLLEGVKGVAYICSVAFPDGHQASPLEESKGGLYLFGSLPG